MVFSLELQCNERKSSAVRASGQLGDEDNDMGAKRRKQEMKEISVIFRTLLRSFYNMRLLQYKERRLTAFLRHGKIL